MTIVSSVAYFEDIYTIDDTTPKTLSDLGVTDDNLKLADYAHISVTSGSNVRFWVSGKIPTTTEGHILVTNGDRIIQGRVNIKNLTLVSQSTSSEICLTLYKG